MKKFLITLLLSLFTLPVLAENTILIVGDSLSAGYGIDPKQGWVELLRERLQERKLHYQVINASISGDTLSNGLQRLPAALKQYQPKITVIELGANDGLRGLPPTLIQKNLDQMISMVLDAKSKVLVLGVRLPLNYGQAYLDQFQQIFQNLKTRDDVQVMPLFLTGVDDKHELLQADGLHPVASAQTTLLNNVWPALQKLL
jgi:acyl-CoA thioesterase-1